MQVFQDQYGVEMRHMWGMTELSPIGSCAGFKVKLVDWCTGAKTY